MQDEFQADKIRTARTEDKPIAVPADRLVCLLCWTISTPTKGNPANWEKVRWTGVLEKIDGKWKIFQMHFSKAEDLVTK